MNYKKYYTIIQKVFRKNITIHCKIILANFISEPKNNVKNTIVIGEDASMAVVFALINKVCFSSCQIVNVISWYCILCIIWSIVIAISKISIFVVCNVVEKIVENLENVIFGKNHEKSLEYSFVTLWFIKFEADIDFFLDWVKYDLVKMYTSISYSQREGTTLYWIERFSMEACVKRICRILKYFINVSWKHLLLMVFSISSVYELEIINLYKGIQEITKALNITVNDVLSIFELFAALSVIVYIVLGIRHKASGAFSLKEERFKELVVLEEELLCIMEKMEYSLDKNIEMLCKGKSRILESGASELTGKCCYLKKKNIELLERKIFLDIETNRKKMFDEFDDVREDFQQLTNLKEKIKQSSLNYSNVYLIDYQTMLTRVGRFWNIYSEDNTYRETKFLSKNSIKEWYYNYFVKPTIEIDGKKLYYSDENAFQKIYDASSILDWYLQRAFQLKLYLEKYERKMTKRLKKIYNFSKLHV